MTRRASGFSLIEVLVSVVVVSVGALSVASLQLVSKRAVRDADQRLEATQLAHALIGKLQANSSAAGLKGYDEVFNSTGPSKPPFLGLGSISSPPDETQPAKTCGGQTDSCSPAELATFDLWLWEQILDGATERYGADNVGGLMSPTACLPAPAAGAGEAGTYTLVIAYRGATALPSNTAVSCGQGAEFDDETPLYGDGDEFRRVVVVQAFITPAVKK